MQLQDSILTLAKIGKQKDAKFAKLNVRTLHDLVWFLPYRLEDWGIFTGPLVPLDVSVTIEVEISSATQTRRTRSGEMTSVVVSRGNEMFKAIWFNQPWIAKELAQGTQIILRCKCVEAGGKKSLMSPRLLQKDDIDGAKRWQPIYSLTASLKQNDIRLAVAQILPLVAQWYGETLPEAIVREAHLMSQAEALCAMHRPNSFEQWLEAKRRLKFEELWLLHFGIELRQRSLANVDSVIGAIDKKAIATRVKNVIQKWSFELTRDQRLAVSSILDDMAINQPFVRLLQGDVGTGKTAVAAVAMLATASAGAQACLVAPTAILAKQHYASLIEMLGDPASVILFLGDDDMATRKSNMERIKDGSAKWIVGTKGVLSNTLTYFRLGLVIMDEQHRFGANEQGNRATETGAMAHCLLLSATPIPRALAMTLYGDMQCSHLRAKPHGDVLVRTRIMTPVDVEIVARKLTETVKNGGKAYVVCPRIFQTGENDKLNLFDIETVAPLLRRHVPSEIGIAQIHGNMTGQAQEEAMQSFLQGKNKILLGTTMIEVGINDPEAVLMVVFNAERFGISQLHQLRGRVGRGKHQSECILLSDSIEPTAHSRLQTLCESNDGFYLADKDMELRGRGDFFGTRQHGLPELRFANLYDDAALSRQAVTICQNWFKSHPNWNSGPDSAKVELSIAKMFPGWSRISQE